MPSAPTSIPNISSQSDELTGPYHGRWCLDEYHTIISHLGVTESPDDLDESRTEILSLMLSRLDLMDKMIWAH